MDARGPRGGAVPGRGGAKGGGGGAAGGGWEGGWGRGRRRRCAQQQTKKEASAAERRIFSAAPRRRSDSPPPLPRLRAQKPRARPQGRKWFRCLWFYKRLETTLAALDAVEKKRYVPVPSDSYGMDERRIWRATDADNRRYEVLNAVACINR